MSNSAFKNYSLGVLTLASSLAVIIGSGGFEKGAGPAGAAMLGVALAEIAKAWNTSERNKHAAVSARRKEIDEMRRLLYALRGTANLGTLQVGGEAAASVVNALFHHDSIVLTDADRADLDQWAREGFVLNPLYGSSKPLEWFDRWIAKCNEAENGL